MRGAGHGEAYVAEVVDELSGVGVVAELVDALGDDRADVVDGFELFRVGINDVVDGGEVFGEDFGGAAAHVEDAECGEDAGEGAFFGGFEGVDEVVGGFVAHAFEVGELIAVEAVEVGEGSDEACGDELFDEGDAEAVDVHLVSGGEVSEAFDELCGAVGIGAADADALGVFGDGAFTLGAFGGQGEGVCLRRAFIVEDLDDLGDDFAGFFDEDGVVDADVFSCEFAEVVEAGAADGGAGELYGLEVGDGSEGSGFSDLDADVADGGLCLFGGEFVGDAPSGGAGGLAEAVALGEVVDFDDHAVDLVVEF